MLSGLAQPVASLGGVGLGVGCRVSVSSGCGATGAGWSWQAGGMVRRALALRGWGFVVVRAKVGSVVGLGCLGVCCLA